METRQERMVTRIMDDLSIRQFDLFKGGLRISEWQVQSGNSPADTLLTNGNAKVWVRYEGKMLDSGDEGKESRKPQVED